MKFRLSDHGRRSVEIRQPSIATTPITWTGREAPMVAEWDAESAVRYAYLANVVVYRCVKVVANSLSRCPFRVGADPDKPLDFDVNAPLAKLLGPPPGGPAPNISARMLWANAVAQWIVTGRFAWEIEPGQRNAIVALWPLVSSKLRAIPSEGGTQFFKRFEYGPAHNPKSLPAERVFYAWNPSLNDWRQPESELQAARLDISVAVMQDRYDFAFLRNDARPAAVIVHEEMEDEKSAQAFKEKFLAEHQGPANAGKPIFIEALDRDGEGVKGSIDIHQLGISQKDAEFIKRYEAKIRNIAISLGVPFSILDASGRTFSNSGAEWVNFWEQRMLPLMADFQDRVNDGLAPLLGDGKVGWFDLSKVAALKEEMKVAVVGAPALLQSQIAQWNEARQMVGLPSLGDQYDRFMTPEEIQALKGASGPAAPERVKPSENGHKPAPKQRAGLSMPFIDHEIRRTKIWNAFNSQAKTLERSWQTSMRQLFKRQLASTLARLEGKRGRQLVAEKRQTPSEIFDPGFWQDETDEIVQALYQAVFAAGGARVAGQFGLAFDIDAPWVQEFIRQRANKLAGDVTQTTFDQIKDGLAKGLAEGESVPDLSKRIRDVFDQADKVRSVTIARTEVISTYNGSAQAVSEQLGPDVVAGQEWIASLDSRVRDEHAEANGQIVAVQQAFIVGGEELLYPGDPAGSGGNTINCRCTIALLTPEEISERKKARVPVRTVERLFAKVATNGLSIDKAIHELASA